MTGFAFIISFISLAFEEPWWTWQAEHTTCPPWEDPCPAEVYVSSMFCGDLPPILTGVRSWHSRQNADEEETSNGPVAPCVESGSETLFVLLWSVSCFEPWHLVQSTVAGGL
jgi:hypothetical protein